MKPPSTSLFNLLVVLFLGWQVHAESCIATVDVTDVIGPATVDLLKRVETFADKNQCGSVLLLINTPGGSLESTRYIVEGILNSERPYLCLVSPSGGHAGSAGAIILQACQVNGALSGTNLGAATPVSMGQEMPPDLRQKILNDTRSWLDSITSLRGRSQKFGRDIILEAKAVSADEAFKLKAIDFVGKNIDEFLDFAKDRNVKVANGQDLKVAVGSRVEFKHDSRFKVLALLTDPQFAYILLLGSLALLYFEITHPGTLIAGVAGSVGLLVALVALHKLEVEWGGLLLIFLGIGMLIAEIFIPAFGVVGIGGLVSFVLGSLFLFDPVKTGGYQLPLTLIVPVVLMFGAMFLAVSYLVVRATQVKKKGGFEDLIGLKVTIVSIDTSTSKRGRVEINGEYWNFESEHELKLGDNAEVVGNHGLILKVKKEQSL